MGVVQWKDPKPWFGSQTTNSPSSVHSLTELLTHWFVYKDAELCVLAMLCARLCSLPPTPGTLTLKSWSPVNKFLIGAG